MKAVPSMPSFRKWIAFPSGLTVNSLPLVFDAMIDWPSGDQCADPIS